MANRPYKAPEWKKMQCKESGMNVKEFCEHVKYPICYYLYDVHIQD